MIKKNRFSVINSVSLKMSMAVMVMLSVHATEKMYAQQQPEGPCDIYKAAGCPCVAAHSSTRVLYVSYNGPLYQVMRQSDGKTIDIGVVKSTADNPGGYADVATQDAFCSNTHCWITKLYDQSGNGNHLIQAPRGGFSGPSMGGFNNLPIADMAPVTLKGHKVYGIFIEPGMGLRLNDANNTAVDDQAQGQYWVINGHHFNSGCCYDYGNAETDSRDDGDGTMETTYYGNASSWYRGQAPGPWIMTDQENNLVGGVNASPNDKYLPNLPSVSWRFVTATADGEPHHWRSMGGDAQNGDLQVMFDGQRISNDRSSYDPMRKQGAILLGNGGDNSNGSQGTFYEGAMTAPGTFPTKETNQKIQANIVAAKYNMQCLSLIPAHATATPPGLQTFSPKSSQNSTVTFTNTNGESVNNLVLSIAAPKGWKSIVLNSKETSKKYTEAVLPGESVSAVFTITSGPEAYNGDLVGKATWTNAVNKVQTETTVEKVRNVEPIKINEFRISDGSAENSTNSFIELYNASDNDVDISNWTLTQHSTQMPVFSSINFPSKTVLASKGFYLLGLSNSGLSVQAKKGESVIYVRNTSGMSVGDAIEIGSGLTIENHKITSITTASEQTSNPSPFGGRRSGEPTTVWQPLPDGPVITIPAGSKNIPVTSVDGFKVGQKMAIGYGATFPTVGQTIEKYEVVTITNVGKPGTQAYLSKDAKAGDTNIKVSSVENISVGDKIRLDINSKGHGIETVTVTRVGTKSSRNTLNGPLTDKDDPGTGLDIAEPLKFNHSSNIPFSVRGTGISFEPATSFQHLSNEPVLALISSITLDQPLAMDHDINAVVRDQKVKTSGYQEFPLPNQWFGGPEMSNRAGNILLRDAAGNVVDGLNFGGLVDPWTAEGYQATSGAGESGNYAPAPVAVRGFRMTLPQTTTQPNKSAFRYPDGFDTDNNANDFIMQNSLTQLVASPAGTNNVKVATVADLNIGQKLIIGSGTNKETAIVAIIGTPGGTTLGNAIEAGKKTFPVANLDGFTTGQTITIDNGNNLETAVIANMIPVRRRFGTQNNNASDSISVVTPLKNSHASGVQVSGTGITFSSALTKAHDRGTQIAGDIPTPGAPNHIFRKPTFNLTRGN